MKDASEQRHGGGRVLCASRKRGVCGRVSFVPVTCGKSARGAACVSDGPRPEGTTACGVNPAGWHTSVREGEKGGRLGHEAPGPSSARPCGTGEPGGEGSAGA